MVVADRPCSEAHRGVREPVPVSRCRVSPMRSRSTRRRWIREAVNRKDPGALSAFSRARLANGNRLEWRAGSNSREFNAGIAATQGGATAGNSLTVVVTLSTLSPIAREASVKARFPEQQLFTDSSLSSSALRSSHITGRRASTRGKDVVAEGNSHGLDLGQSALLPQVRRDGRDRHGPQLGR